MSRTGDVANSGEIFVKLGRMPEEREYTVTRRCRDTYSATVYALSIDDAEQQADLASHWQSHGSEDCETISIVEERGSNDEEDYER